LLDTPAGQIAKKLVDAGVPLSISSRAAGNVGPDKKVQIKKIFTYDLVADPGFQDAQLERVYESAGFSFSEFADKTKNSIVSHLECINESLGLKNNDSVKIYRVENNEEFEKIFTTEKNNIDIMESQKREFVTAEELNKYSIFLKKKMEEMEMQIQEMKSSSPQSSNASENAQLLERIDRLEEYSEYLAENLEDAIKYGEYLAENLDDSINYSKYLAESLDKSISYSKYLAENVDNSISYSEYVAENVDRTINYSKYLAEKIDDGIQYSEYVAENLGNSIAYSEYLAENVDRGIAYSEYLAEKVDRNISYSEYLAEYIDKDIAYSEYLGEKIDQGISYSEYLAEKLDQGISYSEYLAENVNRTISYSEYIAEKLNGTIEFGEALSEKVGYPTHLNSRARSEANLAAKTELFESGFAGDYNNLGSQIDSLIESVQTQKTELTRAQLVGRPSAHTPKAEEMLNENQSATISSSGHKFIDEMPENYAPIWESLNEGQKQSIIAQSAFYRLETPYQINNFWSTRNLRKETVTMQRLDENQQTHALPQSTTRAYGSDYLNWVAQSLEKRF
jgi:hypothetical protein